MKKLLPYIGLALLVVALAFLFVYKQPHRFDDRITLSNHDKIPYGTYAAYNLLQKEFPHALIETNRYAPGEWKTLSNDSLKQVLLIITKVFNPTEDDLDYLINFVQKGNYVFVSALQMTTTATKFFKLKQMHHYDYDGLMLGVHHGFNPFDSTGFNLDSGSFKNPFSYKFPGANFTNELSKTNSAFTYSLGYSSSLNKNLVAIKSINGTIFLHTAPVVFTNFFLLYEDNRQYFEKLMSLLPADTKKVVWDNYYLYNYHDNKPQQQHGLLSVILKYDNFRWAFWVALLFLLLYFITEVKRKQRFIPSYAKPKNDSLEFVTTIGDLYYEKGDHKNLAEKLTQYFLDYVRSNYKISTAEINSVFANQLSVKSNKNISDIHAIIEYTHTINLSDAITQKQLMDYYEALENFYKKI